MPLIDPVLLKTRLGIQAGRFDVDAVSDCDSSSSELLRRAERGAPSGTVIVADRQSAGRGRRGRQWLSEPEASLTFSLLWRIQGSAAGLSGLSLAVGVALARGLESLGAQGICLKWPNDVLFVSEGFNASQSADKFAKLAGILIELSSDRRGTQVCIGIGLNLQKPEADLAQRTQATLAPAGLAQALSGPIDRHAVLAAILLALIEVLDIFAVNGFSGLKTEWQARHVWQDKPVYLLADGEASCQGICRGVDTDGALLLETPAGIERILAGDLSLRGA